jgi:hypothetical protein
MFPYPLYKVVHIVGIVLAMSALGGAALLAMVGASDAVTAGGRSPRRLLAILHGLGAFLILLGGFGMLARLGIVQGGVTSFPGWLLVKLVVWVVVAAALFVPRRRPALARALLLSLPVLGGLAAYMAIYKPF